MSQENFNIGNEAWYNQEKRVKRFISHEPQIIPTLCWCRNETPRILSSTTPHNWKGMPAFWWNYNLVYSKELRVGIYFWCVSWRWLHSASKTISWRRRKIQWKKLTVNTLPISLYRTKFNSPRISFPRSGYPLMTIGWEWSAVTMISVSSTLVMEVAAAMAFSNSRASSRADRCSFRWWALSMLPPEGKRNLL